MKIKAIAYEKYWSIETENGFVAHANCNMMAAIIIRGFLNYVESANHPDIEKNSAIEAELNKTYCSGVGSTFEIDAYKGEIAW